MKLEKKGDKCITRQYLPVLMVCEDVPSWKLFGEALVLEPAGLGLSVGTHLSQPGQEHAFIQ